MGANKNKKRQKKRKFRGNQYSQKNNTDTDKEQDNNSQDLPQNSTEPSFTSAQKIQEPEISFDEEIDNFFFLIDFRQLRNILKYSLCPRCETNLGCSIDFDAHMGFNLLVSLNCSNCDFSESFSSSTLHKSELCTTI